MKITITLNTDNDAFTDDDPGSARQDEIERILREWLRYSVRSCTLRDDNGNTVGAVIVEEEEK